ncbi:MAG: hypothetical protein ACJAZO_004309 [Myxococcota bacterium]|jgi:hypothetical protein
MRLIHCYSLMLLSLFACNDGSEDTETSTPQDDCSNGVCVLSGVYTEDLNLTADTEYLLRGGVFIGDDELETVLTIEAGTVIYGETSTDGFLAIRRHSKIIAAGTAAAPIVFTSSKEEGTRARSDWGGLIINGLAPINACDGGETACESFGEGGTGFYGGDQPQDDSGVISYVRVEFAGTLVSPDNELNGIAFQGVGSGTQIDHIQVHMNADDGVEFFGGTAQAKYILITGAGDDGFDYTDGWQGKAQYVIVQQYADASDQGIEADNNAESNDATPRTAPTLSNVTLIGSPNSAASDIGLLLREGVAGDLSNLVITGFGEACLDIDHTATFNQLDQGLSLTHSLLDCAVNFTKADDDPTDIEDWFNGQDGNLTGGADLIDPTNEAAPNFAPAAGSAATSGGVAPADDFFDDVTFRGAVEPGNDWTADWTTQAAN